MNFLEERILKDGIVKPNNVLKVDSFLNHQMDISLMEEIGREFHRRFGHKNITKFPGYEAGNADAGGFNREDFGDFFISKTAMKFLTDFLHERNVHLVVEKTINL